MNRLISHLKSHTALAALAALTLLASCSTLNKPWSGSQQAPAAPPKPPVASSPATAPSPRIIASTSTSTSTTRATTPSKPLVAPPPIPFEDAITRAGRELFEKARGQLGAEPRALVVDPLIDANTGAQTVSTARMGVQLESIVSKGYADWSVKPLTRQSLAEQPLLLIGTLTPVNVKRSIDTPPDAFRVWLTLIDLRNGQVVAKQIDRATLDSVNPAPLKYYSDSPTWHKDKTVLGYINSCQKNTKIGDLADPDYLAHLPAAAVVNEAIMAYSEGKIPAAHQLYKQAEPLADAGDLRVLNGLYLTNWQLGHHDAAKEVFGKLVRSGLELERLPIKILFGPGKTTFAQVGDLPKQYKIWLSALAEQAGKAGECIRIVGHTSRTGSVRGNERLSRKRAEAVQKMLVKQNRSLSTLLSAKGVASREALVGLGTDDMRDALDRRVEFRVESFPIQV